MSTNVNELYDSLNFYTKTAAKKSSPSKKTNKKLAKAKQEEFISRMTNQNRQNQISKKYSELVKNSPSAFESPKKNAMPKKQK